MKLTSVLLYITHRFQNKQQKRVLHRFPFALISKTFSINVPSVVMAEEVTKEENPSLGPNFWSKSSADGRSSAFNLCDEIKTGNFVLISRLLIPCALTYSKLIIVIFTVNEPGHSIINTLDIIIQAFTKCHRHHTRWKFKFA